MKMVKVLLTDGSTREISVKEFDKLSVEGMMEAFNGKAVVDIKFFEEDGR